MQQAQNRSRNRRSGGCLFICLVAAVAVYLVIRNVLVVRHVDIQGGGVRAQSVQAAFVAALDGSSILRVDHAYIKNSMEADPYIQVQKIREELPNRLIIEVKESAERAIIDSAGVLLLIDDDCRMLSFVNKTPESHVYMIYGMDVDMRHEGEVITSYTRGKVSDTKKLMDGIRDHKMNNQIVSLNVANLNNIYFVAYSGMYVVLGDAEDLDDKFLWYETVHKTLIEDGITTGILDVSGGDRAIYRPY